MYFNLPCENSQIIALVDCNNFYASCERVFNPKLNKKPVVVLSNNDGCAIARSQEAKDIGIKMGQPYFEWEKLEKKFNIHTYSANFPLYGDMSDRVMNTLKLFSPDIEYYSIDEAFLNLTHIKTDYKYYAKLIKETVQRYTGLPVSVGVSRTKTLAKVANSIAKRTTGVCCITNEIEYKYHLVNYPVEKIWGIGRRKANWLNARGIYNAYDLIQYDIRWVKKNLTVVTARTVLELKGVPCQEFEYEAPDKKEIATTRSFGRRVTDYRELEECISAYTASVAMKARQQKSYIGYLQVFIESSPFKNDFYYKTVGCEISPPSSYTPLLTKYGKFLLKHIFKKGIAYKRGGVIVTDFVKASNGQYDLFRDESPSIKQLHLMKTVDNLNKGKKQIYLASEGINKAWYMKQHMLSRKFTTRLNDIIMVK